MYAFHSILKKKDAIISVSKDGHHLLLSLETSGKEEDAQWDVRMDWETVQRYLTSLPINTLNTFRTH